MTGGRRITTRRDTGKRRQLEEAVMDEVPAGKGIGGVCLPIIPDVGNGQVVEGHFAGVAPGCEALIRAVVVLLRHWIDDPEGRPCPGTDARHASRGYGTVRGPTVC